MESQDVIKILKTLPECHLRLLDLVQLMLDEDGEPDMEKVGFYAKEMTEATSEAEDYSNETRKAVECLRRLVHS